VELQVALLLINQSTAMVPPPETVGVQTSDLPEAAVCDACKLVASTHVTALMTAGGRMVMFAVAVRLVCAWATAVMVTTPLLVVGTVAGAVYRPFASIVPTVELPLAMVLTCQFATVLLKFEMVAVHCEVPLAFIEVLEQTTEIAGTAAVVVLDPQEFRSNNTGRTAIIRRTFCNRVIRAQTRLLD
jgi:hypothetical protein